MIYLIAFVSFWIQAEGLVGHDGIIPVASWLEQVRNRFGAEAYLLFPTLCWLNSSDWFLHVLCAIGAGLSLLLIFDVVPVVCLTLLWLTYLSISVAGQLFMNFQWDDLLLENRLSHHFSRTTSMVAIEAVGVPDFPLGALSSSMALVSANVHVRRG